MSFQAASRELGRDKQLTSMLLIGGFDADPDNIRKGVDLRVKGGSLIEKSLVVLGNIYVAGILESELCGDLLTDKIQEKELTQGIDVCGNLVIDSESVLIGNVCIPNSGSLQTPKIEEKVAGAGVCFASNITADGDLTICNTGDLYLNPTGFVIISNVAQELDLSKQIIANVLRMEAADGCPLGLEAPAGFKIEVTGGDGIDLMGRDLCNVGTITSNSGGDIEITSNIDLNCGTLGNISTITSCNNPSGGIDVDIETGFKLNLTGGDGIDMMGRDLCNVGNISGTGNITVSNNIDMNCLAIGNVETIRANLYLGKNSPFFIGDRMNFINGTTGNIGINMNNRSIDAVDNTQTASLNTAPLAGNLQGTASGQLIAWSGTEWSPAYIPSRQYTTDGNIDGNAGCSFLDGSTGGTLNMTINDLDSFCIKIGGVSSGFPNHQTFKIYSLTAHPHTITLGGTNKWDGANSIVTLSGSQGDGLEFMVLSNTFVNIISTKGVTFS